MVGNVTVDTTGTKDVPLKSTGNEKVKGSICLTTKADGTKLKPFIVFQGAEREVTALNEEFKNRCAVVSSSKRLDEPRPCFEIFERGLRNVFL